MPEQTSTQSPAEVLLQRRAVRRSYREWCLYTLQHLGYEPAAHHLLLIDTIEKVLAGEIRNVIFLMPPGSAKSTYLSVLLPPFYLNPEQFPNNLILACSYSYTLIEGFGRQCRDLINLHEHILGYSLSKTAAAAGDWRTTRGGGYFCAGVGSGIAGHRADLAFIDDYLGSQEEADSKVIRDKQWNWYWNDFWPRLKPSAAQIIIANRRHEDDLVGRLLAKEPTKWHVIRLPMLAEENDPLGRKVGERLWGEWFTDEMVEKARSLPRVWAGLYQQRPSPEQGNFFKKEWIVRQPLSAYPNPNELQLYVGGDFGVRKNSQNDKTCLICGGVDSQGRLWIMPDWYWDRADSGEIVEEMLALAKRRPAICWWLGRENITGSIGPFLHKRMFETGVFIPIEELPEGKDKIAKAQSIRARMSAKAVIFPDIPQFDDAEHELLMFPGGLHDDYVDALAKLGQGLAKMVNADVMQREQTLDDVLKELSKPLTYKRLEYSSDKVQRNKFDMRGNIVEV